MKFQKFAKGNLKEVNGGFKPEFLIGSVVEGLVIPNRTMVRCDDVPYFPALCSEPVYAVKLC